MRNPAKVPLVGGDPHENPYLRGRSGSERAGGYWRDRSGAAGSAVHGLGSRVGSSRRHQCGAECGHSKAEPLRTRGRGRGRIRRGERRSPGRDRQPWYSGRTIAHRGCLSPKPASGCGGRARGHGRRLAGRLSQAGHSRRSIASIRHKVVLPPGPRRAGRRPRAIWSSAISGFVLNVTSSGTPAFLRPAGSASSAGRAYRQSGRLVDRAIVRGMSLRSSALELTQPEKKVPELYRAFDFDRPH